ncbi:MAG: hypothetical protein AAF515_19425 [Pseudomonadota bacterium]
MQQGLIQQSRIPSRWRRRLLRASLLGLVAGTLLGCAGADVAPEPTLLPVPLVERLPVTMGIHLPIAISEFVHEEELPNNGRWRIELGSAQQLMFENLASGLFIAHAAVADPAAPGPEVDGILVPNIEQLQFAIPSQTRTDFFEVWIKYQFRLLRPDGSMIAEWPLQAYGRANRRNYGFMEDTQNGALQAAAQLALRDAMAFFSFKFPRLPAVTTWLQEVAQQPKG